MTFSPDLAIAIAASMAMVGNIINGSEQLWLWKLGAYSDRGVWPWQVMRERYPQPSAIVGSLFSNDWAVPALLVAKILVSLAVLGLLAQGQRTFPLLILLFLFHALLQTRTRWGGEGGDQMITLVTVCAALADAFHDNSSIVLAASLFIGAQIFLSYVASGSAKLFGRHWRSGDALRRIMNAHTYGSPWAARFLNDHPDIGRTLSHGVMIFQLSFPLFFLLPMPIALIYPAGGFIFHLSIALLMRLNLFLFVFVGTYPCMLVLHDSVRSILAQ